MNIDFHYGVIYVVARLGGLDPQHAEIVAHACQYVDDATTPSVLSFAGGQSFERFASAHQMLDYKNMLKAEDRVVWAPFHFVPGGQGNTLEDKSICRPDSPIARDMVARMLLGHNANNALHRLGVTLHAYVDTWAHQGFSGTISKHNVVLHLEGDGFDRDTWAEKVKGYFIDAGERVETWTANTISRLGHGAALHFPDMPWAEWKYINGNHTEISRVNLPDFITAADMACRVVQRFCHQRENPTDNVGLDFSTEAGLSAEAREGLRKILASNRSHDVFARLKAFCDDAESGRIPGFKETIPLYLSKGEGSWKHLATGIVADDDGDKKNPPVWSQVFEDSDYRKFHDAIKEHRFVVTQEILPRHGIRLA
jgi:hypothetical protein